MLSFCIFILVTASKGNTFWVFKMSNFNKDDRECIFTYGIRKIKAHSWETLMRVGKKTQLVQTLVLSLAHVDHFFKNNPSPKVQPPAKQQICNDSVLSQTLLVWIKEVTCDLWFEARYQVLP